MERRQEDPLTEEERKVVKHELLRRQIYHFYEHLSRWAPILLMLGHWYGVWDYSHYPRPTILDTEDNGNCIIWMYSACYLYMPFAMIPASFFFHWCWIYRIPFYYFIGISVIRFCYQHWLMTPNQLTMHYILIGLTIIAYAYGITSLIIKSKKCRQNVGK